MIQASIRKKLTLPGGESWLEAVFSLEQGSFVTLYGPSGAGKTTLLKILAGLIRPEEGVVKVGPDRWVDTQDRLWVPAQRRSVGLVFQDYALFPNLTVRENLAFGLPDPKNTPLVDEMLALTGLVSLADRYPTTLSGGQQQRVALARTLVRQPKLLLLDEPFAALDVQTKTTLRKELRAMHQRFGLTTILVSHDPVEIYQLSDYVLELDRGRIVRQGKTKELFQTHEWSAKLVWYGQVLALTQSDVVYRATLQVDQQTVHVILTAQDAQQLSVGDTVQITTKAFNPIVTKVS